MGIYLKEKEKKAEENRTAEERGDGAVSPESPNLNSASLLSI